MKNTEKTIPELLVSLAGKALSTNQVCEIFGFSRQGLHKLTKKTIIPHNRIGDRLKFDPIVLMHWWQQKQIG